MTKITLSNVGSLADTTTAQLTINNNNRTLVTAIDNTLSRDGTSPNTMGSNLDMNSHNILNLPVPASSNEPVRLAEFEEAVLGQPLNLPFHISNTTQSTSTSTGSFITDGGMGVGKDLFIGGTLHVGTFTASPTELDFQGSTSGTTILKPSAVASGTITLPAATDTLIGKATIDTLTHKTYDTAGTGNSFSINGLAATANTGTGAVVRATSPSLITPLLGTPTSGVATNLTGTASGLTAGNVTTNANLTGDVTSVGNATTLANAPVIAKVLTGYTSGAGTISATDSLLSAIQKLNGNDATNANLTGDVTSVGNATTLTNAPVIAKVLTGYTSGAGTVSSTDSILSAIQKLNGNDATNANLTGDVTSVGNATTLAAGSASNLNSGTLPAARMPALTGDISTSAGAVATTIGATKVTSAMLNSDVFSTAHSWGGAQTFTAPLLGTPASGVLTNTTGYTVANLADSAWSTWSPTFTMSSVGGTPITAAVSGTSARYKQIGKTVYFTLDATISNVGVGNGGSFIATLPVTAFNASAIVMATGKEVVTSGKLIACVGFSSTQVSMILYDGTSLLAGGNGARVNIGGFYEAA